MVTVSPGFACRVVAPAIVPGGSTNDPSLNCATTYCLPLIRNDAGASNPGCSAFTLIVYGGLVPPGVVTTICCDPAATSEGTCAFTCPLLMKSLNASFPPIVTFTPSSVVGALVPLKSAVAQVRWVAARLVPKISIHDPGATLVYPPNAPALTTPFAEIEGGPPAEPGVSVYVVVE